MEDFNSLFPAEVTVVVAGETFTLRAFTARHLRPYLNITERLAEKADDLGRKLGHKLATRILGLPADTPHDVVQNARAAYAGPESFEVTDIPLEAIHQACAEEYLDLVAVGLNKPLAWVEELGIDDLVVLAGVIQKLNNDRYLKKPSALTVVATAQS